MAARRVLGGPPCLHLRAGRHRLGPARRLLPFFIEVAPALGLLGTMQGIIECFSVMGGANPGREALAGLGVAAITTVYGLIIALVASIAMFALDAVARTEEQGVAP